MRLDEYFDDPPEVVAALLVEALMENVECMVRRDGHETLVVWSPEEPDVDPPLVLRARIRQHADGTRVSVSSVA